MFETASNRGGGWAAFVLSAALAASSAAAQIGGGLPPSDPTASISNRLSIEASPGAEAQSTEAQVRRGHGKGLISVDFLRHPIPEKVRRMLRRALETMHSGDHKAAREQLLETLAKYPDSAAYVHSLLGVEYVRTARFTDAVSSFEQAASLLPHDAMTHYNFGLSLACARDYDRAEREVRRALELDPKIATAQNLLGVLLQRKQSND